MGKPIPADRSVHGKHDAHGPLPRPHPLIGRDKELETSQTLILRRLTMRWAEANNVRRVPLAKGGCR